MADAVVDTSVLIAFGLLDRLELLPRLYESVWVPDAVYVEATRGARYPEVPRIQHALDAGQIRRTARTPSSPVSRRAGLGAGEAEAIAEAVDRGAVVVLDDSKARQVARSLGLRVVGSVGLLIQARRRELVAAALPLTQALQDAGLRIGPAELEAARAADASS